MEKRVIKLQKVMSVSKYTKFRTLSLYIYIYDIFIYM